MFKRFFWVAVGAMGGFGGSWWLQQRVKRAVDRFAPGNVQADAKAAVAEGREAMRRREVELRERYRPRSASFAGPGSPPTRRR